MENLKEAFKIKENFIANNYFNKLKKDDTKKITCKEKNLNNFINSFIHDKTSIYSNYNYSKTTKVKNNNLSFQNTPIMQEEILYKNIYNNRDLINEPNIERDSFINTKYNYVDNNKKDKKFINVKNKTKINYLSHNNLKNFFIKDENDIYNNNLHLIKSEKKFINFKQKCKNNKSDMKTSKIPEKSKKIFTNIMNMNEYTKKEKKENQSNIEDILCKTENNFYHTNKSKNHGRNIKSLINNSSQISKLNMDFSNKSTKIKNIFIKHKTQNKIGIINLKFENINKKKEDMIYIKSNNNILINNNKIIKRDKTEKNNLFNFVYNSNNNKNYKISSQNKKQNLIINNISQNNINNLTPSENILCNFDNSHDNLINNKKKYICNNQIIYNDNKNIFIQNNYINGKLNSSKKITNSQTPNNLKKQIYIKNKSFDNSKQNSSNNYITNLKNFIPIGEHFNNAINNIKNIFLGNKNEDKKEEEKNKDVNNKITNDNNDDKSSIIDDSIIMNSSDVYGTLNFSKSLNNINNSEIEVNEGNESPKDNKKKKTKKENNNLNKNDIKNDLIINSYSNFRETITMNMNLNNNNINKKEKDKTPKKILLSEILANKNNNKTKTPKKENKKININFHNNKKSENKLIEEIKNYKQFSVLSNAGKNFGVKKTNQDTPVASVNINGVKGFNIFGVLDGHGTNGHHVSQFLSNYLVEKISKNEDIIGCKDLEKIYERIKKSNYELLVNIFLKSDEALNKQYFDATFSGTTCVLVIQIGKKIICANVGDSRAILVYNNKSDNDSKTSIFNLSHDFKPDLPEEKKRIYKMGGIVEQMQDMNGLKAGPPRVWGVGKNYPGLAMSRSLGDFKGKKYGIISLPEIIETNLDENANYIVICSDGVWEFLTNENVMEIGNKFYEKNDANGFTKKLAETSERIWEQKDVIVDDITAIVVFY